MPAVSNTSPVFNLACIGRLNLLRTLFQEIWIPSEVDAELGQIPDATIRGRIDEGREMARRLGLHITGVLGVLLRAKRVGQIAAIKPELVALREQARFFVANELEARILEEANE